MTKLTNKEFLKQLEADPKLLEHFKQLFSIAHTTGVGGIRRADDAEEAVVLGLRGLGKEILNEWALSQEQFSAQNLKQTMSGVKAHSKKNSIG